MKAPSSQTLKKGCFVIINGMIVGIMASGLFFIFTGAIGLIQFVIVSGLSCWASDQITNKLDQLIDIVFDYDWSTVPWERAESEFKLHPAQARSA